MTIPWMMNCGHSGDGWCLTCVANMGDGWSDMRNELWRLRDCVCLEDRDNIDLILAAAEEKGFG